MTRWRKKYKGYSFILSYVKMIHRRNNPNTIWFQYFFLINTNFNVHVTELSNISIILSAGVSVHFLPQLQLCEHEHLQPVHRWDHAPLFP